MLHQHVALATTQTAFVPLKSHTFSCGTKVNINSVCSS